MILISIVISFILIFLSGVHFCAYKIDKMDGKERAIDSLGWSIGCGLIGLYNLISLVGLASRMA